MVLALPESQLLMIKQPILDISYLKYFDIVIISRQRKRVKEKQCLTFCQSDAMNLIMTKQKLCLHFKMI